MIDDFPVFDEALRISVLYAAVQSFGHPYLSGFVADIQRFVHGDIGEYTLSVFTKSLGSFGFGYGYVDFPFRKRIQYFRYY